MIRVWFSSLFVACLALLAGPATLFADSDAPDFNEVYGLVREHVQGMTDADLNRAAVQGLVSALAPKICLITNGFPANPSVEGSPLIRSNLFDGDMAYLRVGRVAEGLAQAVRGACDRLGATNKLKGLILDLRYADGDDYAAAAAVADLFLKKERPLLNWGDGLVRSKEKDDAINLPVAGLGNGQTDRPAQALAAGLRETATGVGLADRRAGHGLRSHAVALT